MDARLAITGVLLAAAFAAGSAAAQSRLPRYETSSRLRLPAEVGCMKDELMHGPSCVKKCQENFRLEFEGKVAVCIGLKADARYEPPKPEFTPPPPRQTGGSKGY
jgi:hypothetical protein